MTLLLGKNLNQMNMILLRMLYNTGRRKTIYAWFSNNCLWSNVVKHRLQDHGLEESAKLIA